MEAEEEVEGVGDREVEKELDEEGHEEVKMVVDGEVDEWLNCCVGDEGCCGGSDPDLSQGGCCYYVW